MCSPSITEEHNPHFNSMKELVRIGFGFYPIRFVFVPFCEEDFFGGRESVSIVQIGEIEESDGQLMASQ